MATTEEQQIIRDRDSEIANIRANVEWTEEAKNERIAAVHEWARNEVHAAREHEAQQREARLERSKQAVFRVDTGSMATGAEESAIFLDYRAARSEVKAATEDFSGGPHQVYENLKELLEQAELTGYKQLARAVYHRAINVGASEVIERFIASRPKDATAYRNYVQAQEEMNRASSIEHLLADALTEQQLNG